MSRFSLGEYFLKARKGIWQICWYDSATRQTKHTSTGLRDFEEAKVRLAEHVVRYGDIAGARAEDVPVEAILDRYYEGHAKALPSADYSRYAITYWRKHWSGRVVSDITASASEGFVSELVKAGLSPGSVNRVLGVGRAALSRAHKRGEIDRLPFIPSVKVPAPKMARATPADLAAILNGCNGELEHVRRWLLISMGTLARPEAVLELAREQCDFDLGRIDLCQLGRPQSRKVRPVVPMVRSIRGLLEASPPGRLVTYRGEPLADIRMGFERARARAGVSKHITPYTVRRTLASELRRRGVPPWEIAGFLGHSARDYRTTEVYAEFSPDYLGTASTAIDAYFEELRPLLDFELPEVRITCVPDRVPRGFKPEEISYGVNGLVVGAAGIEPATTTMSRGPVGNLIKDLATFTVHYSVPKINTLPDAACQMRAKMRRIS